MRAESDTMSISCFLAFWFVIKETWGYSLSRFVCGKDKKGLLLL